MGFWDAGIGGLEASGISVSDDQIDMLEEGGQVLVIKGLLSPFHWYGDETGILDQDDNLVYVPLLMEAVAPMSTELPEWRISGRQIRKFMDDYTGDTMWRAWPSYIGEYIQEATESPYGCESFSYARVWDGTPLVSATDRMLAHEIFTAARKRVNDSVYEEFCILTEFESSGSYSVSQLDPFLAFESEDVQGLEDFDEYDPGYMHCVLSAYRDLLAGNYLTNCDDQDPRDLKDIEFKPMSHYLGWLPEAMVMWERMVSRHENAHAIIRSSLSAKSANHFNIYEGQVS